MTDKETPPAVNPEETFLQNIVRLGRERKPKVTLSEIQEATGLQPSALVTKKLSQKPNFRNFDQAKAEAAITLVAPAELHKQLRQLEGYPPLTIDHELDTIRAQREKEDVGTSELRFGLLYRFSREQRPVLISGQQRYLNRDECAEGILGGSTLSELEKGKRETVSLPEGLALIGRLGYTKDKAS
jgi:hypothetical protein